jgi:hypothetical protein
MPLPVSRLLGLLVLAAGAAVLPRHAAAQDDTLPRYLRDRGTGIPSSQFGTYISRGEFLIYPFFAYSLDNNREYQPSALGFGLNQDFRGKFKSYEGQIFLAYGVNDWLALEFSASYISATLDKSPSDPSATPAQIKESGVADLEGQLRFRLMHEGNRRPELFGFLEMTPATQTDKVLISEPDWDLKPGVGVVRGFSWGTMQVKIAAEWNREASSPDLGEVTIEYLKRLSPTFRLNVAVEGGEGGAPDEFELITGLRCRIANGVYIKFDNSVGISSKATDWAPEIGLMFSFPH